MKEVTYEHTVHTYSFSNINYVRVVSFQPMTTTHLLSIEEYACVQSGLQSSCYHLQEVAKDREDLLAKA